MQSTADPILTLSSQLFLLFSSFGFLLRTRLYWNPCNTQWLLHVPPDLTLTETDNECVTLTLLNVRINILQRKKQHCILCVRCWAARHCQLHSEQQWLLHNNTSMANLCRLEEQYIRRSSCKVSDAALKKTNVRLLLTFFRRVTWLNRPQWQVSRCAVQQFCKCCCTTFCEIRRP